MATADCHNRNGHLTASEMLTFLQNTQFEPFAGWMLGGRPRRFTHYDSDADGIIDELELARAVSDFLDQEDDDDLQRTMRSTHRREKSNTGNSPPWIP